MKYAIINDEYYIRIDPNEEIMEVLKRVCEEEKIHGGHKDEFTQHEYNGLLEMASLMGNVTIDKDRKIQLHAHGVFSYLNANGEPTVTAGHLSKAYVSYTGEIILRPAHRDITQRLDVVPHVAVWNV